MPLVEFPFATGIDQRTRPEYVDGVSAWLALENIRVPKTGGADKRFGFAAGTLNRIDGTTRSAGSRMFDDQKAQNVLDGTTLDAYSTTAARNVSLGRVPEAMPRLIDLPTMGKDGSASDIEYCNGYFAITNTSTVGSTNYSSVTIVDAATNSIVHGPFLLGAFYDAIVTHYGNYFIVVTADTGTTTIATRYLDTTSATTINTGWVAIGNVTTAWGQNGYSVVSMSDRVAIGFGLAAGTDRFGVKTWNISGVVESATINTSSATPSSVDIAMGPNADTLWCVWNESLTVKVKALTPTSLGTVLGTTASVITLSASATATASKICAHGTTSSKARVLAWETGSSINHQTRTQGVTIAAGAVTTDGSGKLIPGPALMGRPFAYGSRYYCIFLAGSSTINTTSVCTAVVCDFTDDVNWLRPVASLDLLAVMYKNWPQQGGKAVTASSSTKRYLLFNTRRSSLGNGAQLAEIDFASTDRWQAVPHANSTYLSGGILGYTDGRRFNEAGFIYRPIVPTVSTSGVGMTLTLGRRYVWVFECVDADGNLSISGISDPSGNSGPIANKTITITGQPYCITYRQDSSGLALGSTRIVLYATADNGGVPPYYRHTVLDNDVTSGTCSTTDAVSDATLTASQKLYEQPGVTGSAQDRRAPPGLRHLTSYNGMLVGAIGRTVWHSGQQVVGEAPWFNPVFQVPIDGDGEITGLASMDGTLFVFKRRAVWAISGEPPSDNGATGGMGTPRRLATDVGCIEQRSIVVTAQGVFFQSERGIEILTRAQTVEWIGESIQDEITARPYVMAATLDPGEVLVYFELASGVTDGAATGTGRGLVYDLSLKKWVSTDRRMDVYGHTDAPAQSACILWNGSAYRYAWLDVYGNVYTEDQTTYLDPGSQWVTKRAESAWAKAGGIQGIGAFERAMLMGKYATDANLVIYPAYDYSTTYQSGTTYTRATIAALTAGTGGAGTMPNVHLEHRGNDDAGACMSVRVKIEDATPTGGTVGTGQGCVWSALAMQIQPTSGDGYLLPDGAR